MTCFVILAAKSDCFDCNCLRDLYVSPCICAISQAVVTEFVFAVYLGNAGLHAAVEQLRQIVPTAVLSAFLLQNGILTEYRVLPAPMKT